MEDQVHGGIYHDEQVNIPVRFLSVKLKDEIKEELGFTVNIGISTNFLLSKMAGDFSKPDKVHTLFPEEIEKKMWPLPVSELFFVGKATTAKLHRLGIYTIGVYVSKVESDTGRQYNLFDMQKYDRLETLNRTVDKIGKSMGKTLYSEQAF